ncbi:MAG: FHA domain-containing protein [Gammaproteobacteria bacterium]
MQIQIKNIRSRTGHTAAVTASAACTLGSDPGNALVLSDAGVLARHARVLVKDDQLVLERLDRAAVTVNGQPLPEAIALRDGDWVTLGETLYQIRILSPDGPRPSERTVPTGPPSRPTPSSTELTIGRLAECTIQIPSPLVSREHARLTWHGEHWAIEDLKSANGTFVNGKRLVGRTTLNMGDRVAIATFGFLFTGSALEVADEQGRVRIEVRDLGKEVIDRKTGTGKRLLDGINLVIEPGEFVVIFGTSGSGKSTLLDALNGRRPASTGQVLYNSANLYQSFDRFRAAIGYVPQQDIVHRKIVVRHAMQYTAKLRLPSDTSSEEIDGHVARVLERVGLGEKADLPIDTPAPLSGGQLKRVSLAVELVANPNVLFLDEVTSGLDAGTDKRMMTLFRSLAEDSKTVVCVSHTLENIDACHLVCLLHRGRLVYFGPPRDAPAYFKVARLAEVYELLETQPAEHWAVRYAQSNLYRRYVEERRSAPGQTGRWSTADLVESKPPKASWWSQLAVLTRRYLDLMLSDRRNLAILLLQAPVIAGIIGLVFDTDAPFPQRAATEGQVAFILVLSAIWFGCMNAAREVVKELPIYLRERSVNLSISAYLASKVLPLVALSALQCALLMGIVASLIALPGEHAGRFLILFLASVSASFMGLAVSACVDSNDKATALIPILLVPQVVLSNAIVPLTGAAKWFAQASMVSFWGYDAVKATLSQDTLAVKDPAGEPVLPVLGDYWSDLAAVAILGVLFIAAAYVALKLRDRNR